MSLHLGLLLFSFIFTGIAAIPFIDLLYRLQMTLPQKRTPVGGGLLIIVVTTFLFWVTFPLISRFGVFIQAAISVRDELNVIFLTLISFGLVGLYEDLSRVFNFSFSQKLKNIVLLVISLLVGFLLHSTLNLSIINLPVVGIINLSYFYILLAAIIIFIFIKGFYQSDNLDGFTGGSLLITLLAFWIISVAHLDTPIAMFIAIWTGSLIAFLYFNVYPSRITLGSTGSYSFGATIAVIGLILGKPISLMVIGSVFVIMAVSALFKFSPSLWFVSKGWPEPKVVQRGWLFVILSSVIGLWFSSL